ncbi:hypothetical protein K8I85_17675 [bacterium]|nr:hypothetical protein [bacterium]
MAFGRLVAARFLDGTLCKGVTVDFKTGCTWFHVRQDDGEQVRIETQGLKAIFFIKSVDGDAAHKEEKDYESKKTPEKKVWVEFIDGECLAGWSSALGRDDGFYLTPTDPDSNMERVFIYRAAVAGVSQGDDAVRAAAEHQKLSDGITSGSRWLE